MPSTPPTTPGPLPPVPSTSGRAVLRGMGVHAACVAGACVVVPILMGSNIWPIAAVFWAVMTVPVALVTGAAAGWAVRRGGVTTPMTVLVVTGAAVAIVVGIIMSQNR